MLHPYHAILAPALALSLVVPTATAAAQGPAAPREITSHAPAEQTQWYAVPTRIATAEVQRDSYSAEKPKPKPRPAAAANRWSGGAIPAASRSGASIVNYAMQFVGKVPYGTGNHPSTSFSCDGLVQYVYAAHGVSLPRIADAQAARGVVIPRSAAQPGDLVWYPGQHIGIYAGGNMMIDSPKPGMYVSHRAMWGSPLFVRIP